MVIQTLLFVWFTIQSLIAAEQSDNHFLITLPLIVENGYSNLDSETLNTLCLVSKQAYQATVAAADRHYSIHDKELTNTACIKLICSRCFAENCLCKSKKYRGLFCRTAPDKICHRAILDSSHTHKLLDLQNSMKRFQHLMQPQVFTAQMPTQRLPWDRHANDHLPFSYDCISRPYFIKNTNSIGVLEGIPNIRDNQFGIPDSHTICELECSNNGTCSRREAYFRFRQGNKELDIPLGFLTLFPTLQKGCVNYIEQQEPIVIRGDVNVSFLSETFNKKYFSEQNMLHVIQNMTKVLNDYHWCFKSHNNFESFHTYCSINAPYPNGFFKEDRTDLVRFAYCAKSFGNEKLAIFFLKLYDVYEKNLLIAGPITKESENKVSSDYNGVLEKLASLSSVEDVITMSKEKGSSAKTALVQRNNNTFHFVASLLHVMQPNHILAGIWRLLYRTKNS